MTQRNSPPPHLHAWLLSADIASTLKQTQHILAESRSLLATHTGPLIAPLRTSPPDALCAVFDALLVAARHVANTDDRELFALVERALLHAGEQIERHADACAVSTDRLQ